MRLWKLHHFFSFQNIVTFGGFPGSNDDKEPTCQCRRHKRCRSSGGGHGNPLQYSCLENPLDRGAWWSIGSQRGSHDWSDLASSYFTMLCSFLLYSKMNERYIYKYHPGGGHSNPLQHSCLENPIHRSWGYTELNWSRWVHTCVHISSILGGFLSHLGHHRALSRVPCSIP